MDSEQISIQKEELPYLKRWLNERNETILKIVNLKKEGLRVIIKK